MRALAIVLLLSGVAHAQDLSDRFNVRVSLSGEYLTETQSGVKDSADKIAGPLHIGYGELRLTLDGRRLADWDVHADGRVRLTGGENLDSLADGGSVTTAQGYLGGREYQLYELYAHRNFGKVELSFGRLLVTEADTLRLDGVRLWIHASKRWSVSLYGGGYLDPYSRSLDTDYLKGAPAFVGGVAARYTYTKIWGSFSANAAYLGGKIDDEPVTVTPMTATAPESLAFGTSSKNDNIRAYITWTNFWRPIKWVDFYHDLVVDVWGAAKTQLTRLDFYVAGHLTKKLTLRAGYDHMSAIAVETYLVRLLNDRTLFQQGSIENNLTLSRTARDEGRVTLEGESGRTVFVAEGRLRRRVLVTPDNDQQFVYQPGTANAGSQVAPSLGYDVTLSARNRGSVWGLRPSIWATYLNDYRTRDIYIGLGVGRDFLDERLSVDLSFTYANVHDDDAGQTCNAGGIVSTLSMTLSSCFGSRRGNDYQAGLSLGTTPTRHWFAFVDYRAGIATSDGVHAVLTHVLVGRIEARY